MTFRSHQRVRFHEADPAGIAFFANAYVYAHTAYDELLRAGGVTFELIAARGTAVPLKKSSAEHLRPLPAGGAFDVDVDVLRLGSSSFTLRHRLLLGGEVAAVVETVHVHARVEPDRSMKAEPLPDDLRAALSPHLITD
ncbi:MAG: thioesterase family protein [Deltaproteobacteria bacterium]|nr:thioesterase family protein [Deltaproteobacteria bacterium]